MGKKECERCVNLFAITEGKVAEAVGQYFIDFKKLMWLCKRCTKVMATVYGHELRERERFEKQIRALIDKQ